jgi:L-lysine 4-chlorinase
METTFDAHAVDARLRAHLETWLTPDTHFDLYSRFHRDGFVKVRDIVPDTIRDVIHADVLDLLEKNAERRDLLLATTGRTPRFMSVVRSELIAGPSSFINTVYVSAPLLAALARIAGEELFACPLADEKFLITSQDRKGDTHGWHWGDFSFALIWIIDAPPLENGGMLQCVPHTVWNKSAPRIHQYLCDNPIATYGFVPGDLYLLRTDTTLHRTVPLTEDARRVILNMTWASAKDLRSGLDGNDRWWEDSAVEAASTVRD